MKVVVNNEKTNNREFVFTRSPWSGKMGISIDGVVATKLSRREFKFSRGEDEEFINVIGNDYKGIDLELETGTITILEKISIVESLFAIIPTAVMVVLGGAIGAVIAVLGSFLLLQTYRNFKNIIAKVTITILIYGLVFLVWLVIVTVLLDLQVFK